MVGVVNCMARSFKIAGEHVKLPYVCLYHLQDLVQWPDVLTLKFPPARPLGQGTVAIRAMKRHGALSVGPGAFYLS